MQVETHEEAFATGFRVLSREAWTQPVPPRSRAARWVTLGALYRRDGTLITASTRPDGRSGDRVYGADPARVPEIPPGSRRITGRVAYLGYHMNHYGHFITESLSRMWGYSDFHRYERFVMFPFVFASGAVRIQDFHRVMQRALGLDPARLLILDRPAVFESIEVFGQAWPNNAEADPIMRSVYARIVARYRKADVGHSLFLSRPRGRAMRIANPAQVEAIFAARGFEVIYPETLPIETQLERYTNARVLAGFSGSGLHNCVFAREGTPLIEVGDPRTPHRPGPMQAPANAVAGVRPFFIRYQGDAEGHIDGASVEAQLAEVIKALARQ